MFDECERLAANDVLRRLLDYYARCGGDDADAWQDRLMDLPGVRPDELVRLHGELIAFGWVEQNTGIAHGPPRGAVPCCYRITRDGRCTLRRAQAERAGCPLQEAA